MIKSHSKKVKKELHLTSCLLFLGKQDNDKHVTSLGKTCTVWCHLTAVRLCTNLFQVDIISQFHVLSVNLQNLQSASRIRNADVHLPIKTTCIWLGSTNTVISCNPSGTSQYHLIGEYTGMHNNEQAAKVKLYTSGSEMQVQSAVKMKMKAWETCCLLCSFNLNHVVHSLNSQSRILLPNHKALQLVGTVKNALLVTLWTTD